jgi:hypothetical protein
MDHKGEFKFENGETVKERTDRFEAKLNEFSSGQV